MIPEGGWNRLPAPRLADAVRARIREIADFPVPGVSFKDITPVLADGTLFPAVTGQMAALFGGAGVTRVAAIESRGFVFGAPVAQELRVGLVPVRKAGKLPYRTESVSYELEYGHATLEVHADAWGAGDRVLVVDDVLATGGTALATCDLVERMGATVSGLVFLLSLRALGGEERLAGLRVETILRY